MTLDADKQGLTTRIGVITPDDAVNDDEYNHYLPPGVTLLWTRYRTPRRFEPISVEMVAGYGDLRVIRDAAETLAITRPHVTMFCCNSCSFVHGPEGDRRIRETIAAAAGGLANSITDSEVLALRALGVKNIAVGAPYAKEVTAKLVGYLQQSGFQVVKIESLGLDSEWKIGNTPASAWRDVVRRLDSPDAEAVLLACSGIRAFDIISSVESELGKPVLPAPAVVMWRSLRMAGVQAKIPGAGVLFEKH